MGYELMQLAMVHGAHLPARPYKVLLRMCWQALDRDSGDRPARLYFAGWEPLALAMGYDPSPAGRESAKTNVRRAVRDLTRDGFIEAVGGHAGFGVRQTYLVRVGLTEGGSIQPPNRGADLTPLRGADSAPQQGGQIDPAWGADLTPPRKEEEPQKEPDQDATSPSVVTLPVAKGCARCGGRVTSDGDCVDARCAPPDTGEGAFLTRVR